MKTKRPPNIRKTSRHALTCELLILPDGNILVHNLTQPMATILSGLNPANTTVRPRTGKPVKPARKP